MSELIEIYEDEGFAIRNDIDAEYAIKRIKDTQAEVDVFKDYYADSIEKMQKRADGIKAYYMNYLYEYFQTLPHKTTKTQESYELPSAKLVLKKQAPEYVRNDEVVMKFLHDAEEERFIKVKESLDWAELKKNIDVRGNDCVLVDSGEVVPGIEVVERERKFDVSFK